MIFEILTAFHHKATQYMLFNFLWWVAVRILNIIVGNFKEKVKFLCILFSSQGHPYSAQMIEYIRIEFLWWNDVRSSKHIVEKNFNNIMYNLNPCSPEGFSQTYFPKGGCCNPPWIINTEGHITLNLLPVYRYGHSLSIDTKISTNH